jgi:hypothetical protein
VVAEIGRLLHLLPLLIPEVRQLVLQLLAAECRLLLRLCKTPWPASVWGGTDSSRGRAVGGRRAVDGRWRAVAESRRCSAGHAKAVANQLTSVSWETADAAPAACIGISLFVGGGPSILCG